MSKSKRYNKKHTELKIIYIGFVFKINTLENPTQPIIFLSVFSLILTVLHLVLGHAALLLAPNSMGAYLINQLERKDYERRWD